MNEHPALPQSLTECFTGGSAEAASQSVVRHSDQVNLKPRVCVCVCAHQVFYQVCQALNPFCLELGGSYELCASVHMVFQKPGCLKMDFADSEASRSLHR